MVEPVSMLVGVAHLVTMIVALGERARIHKDNCENLVQRIKLIAPLIDEVKDSKTPLSEQAIAAFEQLENVLEKSKKLLEKCGTCSKMYMLVRGNMIINKFQDVTLDLDRCLQLIPLVNLKVSDDVRTQLQEVSDMLKKTKYAVDHREEQMSNELQELLAEQKEGIKANRELLAQLKEALEIKSSESIQGEAMALEEEREEARGEKDRIEEQYINQIIELLKNMDAADASDPAAASSSSSASTSGVLGAWDGAEEEDPIPADMKCPLSLELMGDPVIVVPSGVTYERAYIQRWMDDGNLTCPKTRVALTSTVLTPNYSLKSMIQSWCEKNNYPVPEPIRLDPPKRRSLTSQFAVAKGSNGPLVGDSSGGDGGGMAKVGGGGVVGNGGLTMHADQYYAQPGNAGIIDFQGAGHQMSVKSVKQMYAVSPEHQQVAGAGWEYGAGKPRRCGGEGAMNFMSGEDDGCDGSSPGWEEIYRQGQHPGAVGMYNGYDSGAMAMNGGIAARHRRVTSDCAEGMGDGGAAFRGGYPSHHSPVHPRMGFAPRQRMPPIPQHMMDGGGGALPYCMSGPRPPQHLQPVMMAGNPAAMRMGGGPLSRAQSVKEGGRFSLAREASPTPIQGPIAQLPQMSPEEARRVRREEEVAEMVKRLEDDDLQVLRQTTGELRLIAKFTKENRAGIAAGGGIPPLIRLLASPDAWIVENAVTALLNLSINMENKTDIVSAGAVPEFVRVLRVGSTVARENTAAALFSLSVNDENKVLIGQSGAIPALVDLLVNGGMTGKKDAATALYNLSILPANKLRIVRAGAVGPCIELMKNQPDQAMVEKAVAVVSNLATIPEGRAALGEEGAIPVIVETLEVGSWKAKENAAVTLLFMALNSQRHRALLIQEGAMPYLVALSKSEEASARAQEKANALLKFLRDGRLESMRREQSIA
ncbi:hypothetical protein CBR_g46708 [Chara braunii]|uniref:RING-type E3 ubiquitin transferase n=1 Tax=Chara braunii TaxID=69332 RepID=A0A388K3W7_CHABU|nr:hypothetical protein CBR_g46708 [Chara braunii]|eukprot:GBG64750.1 hypothetical protein CBR_g46708 [Chara braunii]